MAEKDEEPEPRRESDDQRLRRLRAQRARAARSVRGSHGRFVRRRRNER
jgi:hypothetical protein